MSASTPLSASKEKKKKKRSLSTSAASPAMATADGTPKKAKKKSKAPKTPKTPKVAKTPKSAKKRKRSASRTSLASPAVVEGSKVVATSETGLAEIRVKLRLHLLPCTLGSVNQGILHGLMSFLMKYNDQLGGVVLSFSHVVVPKRDAVMLADFPHMHFLVRCKMLLFTPTVGAYLTGVISQVGFDHVGLLVFGHFNASIAAENMPTAYERDAEEDRWVGKTEPSRVLQRGSVVKFRVSEIHQAASGTFSIAGDMTAPEAGPLGIIEELPVIAAPYADDEDEEGEEDAMDVDTPAPSVTKFDDSDSDEEVAEADSEEEAEEEAAEEVKEEQKPKKKKKKKDSSGTPGKKRKRKDGDDGTPSKKRKKE